MNIYVISLSYICSHRTNKTICMKLFKLLFISLILSLSSMLSAQTIKHFGDSLLWSHSNEMFDSVHNEKVFFEMCEDGLARANNINSAHFKNVYRVAPLTFYKVNNRREEYVEACSKLLAEYQAENNVGQIYAVWRNLHAQQLNWGLYVEAVATNQAMANYAQEHHHLEGIAASNYCFAQSYNNNFQFDEALHHYKLAWQQYREAGSDGMAAESGFGLCGLFINQQKPDEILAYCDSIPRFIQQWEKRKGNINPVYRVRLHRLRHSAYLMKKDKANEALSYDSMLYYNNIYADGSQHIPIYVSKSNHLNFIGKHEESAQMMKELIDYYVNTKNYGLAAGYSRALAHQAYTNQDNALALDMYRNFAQVIDSANIQKSSTQLNRLTKQFRLKELEHENEVAILSARLSKGTAITVIVICLFLVVLLYLYIRYNRRLLRHNRNLYKLIRQKAAAEEQVEALRKNIPQNELNKEEALFREINTRLWEEKCFTNSEFNRHDLAALVGTNRTYLGDAIRQCTEDGLTVSEYINVQRLKYACMLLETADNLSIENIAIDSGYNSTRTFFRQFKLKYGLTPTEYRNVSRK